MLLPAHRVAHAAQANRHSSPSRVFPACQWENRAYPADNGGTETKGPRSKLNTFKEMNQPMINAELLEKFPGVTRFSMFPNGWKNMEPRSKVSRGKGCYPKISAAHLGRKGTGRNAEGIRNANARHWALRAPSGVVYRIKNLHEFVRNHLDWFDPEDTRLRPRGGFKNASIATYCRAVAGLTGLRSGNKKKVNGSWKGWTWAHGIEYLDVLSRKLSKTAQDELGDIKTPETHSDAVAMAWNRRAEPSSNTSNPAFGS